MKRMLFAIALISLSLNMQAQQWETVLPDSTHMLHGFIDSDDNTYYVGFSQNEQPFSDGAFVKVCSDGQYELKTFTEHGEKHLAFTGVLPLTNGNILVMGRNSGEGIYEPGELKILILDQNLDIVSEQTIQVAEGFHGFYGSIRAVIDDDGTVVIFAVARRSNPNIPDVRQFIGVMFRFTQEGECLNCRYLTADPPAPLCYINQIFDLQLINDPYSNYSIILCAGRGGVESILYFDYDFNLLNDYIIDDPSIPEAYWWSRSVQNHSTDYWYNENEMLVVATQQDTIKSLNHPHVLIGCMNRQGVITEKIEINKPDTLMYSNQIRCGMAYANDSTIYVLARCNTVDWIEPLYSQVYLVNNELELLGCISFWDDVDYWPIMILPTSDDGCICVTIPYGLFYDVTPPKICRFSREDFNPVWSIKERPKQEILSSVYPNPAKDEIHFDLTNIPTNSGVRLCISSMTGQTFIDRIIRGSGNLLTVGIETLPSGVYTYSIYDKGKTLFSGKFIKD